MANTKSSYQLEVDLAGASRNYSPSRAPLHQTVRQARFNLVPTGTHAEANVIPLGSLGLVGCRVLPEISKIRGTGNTTMAVKFTLGKTDADGTNFVALSAQTAQVTDPVVTTGFTIPSAGGAPPELAETDILAIKVNYGTGTTLTLAAASTQQIEIGYTLEG
ncbi:hypothetical protein UFOVP1329_16 [uncultured Caudovirales phage]|uniref:Uncharacterized protein n=1 Tax=uncultured Caudovirales phage TaxID=2100421 RepID=A0A6J5ST98_9CAUD|nr:hypothetical protein UFOVP1150_41 [uncultured Caudovirales phage]CAB4199036.1 hypothetical protein UFOVP1329_16 [uncultured Caudovirales phage]CAB4218490.1 hypothetical protein UFOVP1595_20 [uncultured Caudovirales phage]